MGDGNAKLGKSGLCCQNWDVRLCVFTCGCGVFGVCDVCGVMCVVCVCGVCDVCGVFGVWCVWCV